MDLNLIRVFISIYELKSITEAAKTLNVTQPSISYALKKLRTKFSDELFIRHQTEMLPTLKSEKIYKVFKNSIEQIDNLLLKEKNYKISDLEGNIKIAVSDLGASFFIPYIYEKIRSSAPKICLEVIQLDNKTIKNSMLRGDIDLCICNKMNYLEDFSFNLILKDEYICIMDKNHEFDSNNLMNYNFISVSSHAGHQSIEDWMKKNNFKFKLILPNFNLLEFVIKNKDHIAIVPYTLTKNSHSEIRIIDLPFEFPNLEIGIYTSHNSTQTTLCDWLISEICNNNWYY